RPRNASANTSHIGFKRSGEQAAWVRAAKVFCFQNSYFGFRLWETNVTLLAEVSEIELKRCPRCEESLPLSEFGVCRARKDGLNLYCKRCIRQKISLSRQALREYKKARVKRGSMISSDDWRLTLDKK